MFEEDAARLTAAIALQSDEERGRFFANHEELRSVKFAERLAEESARLARTDPQKTAGANESLRWLAEDLDDDYCRGRALRAEANYSFDQGDYQEALAKFDRVIEIFSSLGRDLDVAITRNSGLLCVSLLGQHDRAARWADKAREVFQQHGDRLRLARLDLNFANILFRRDRWEEAAERYHAAHAELVEIGNPDDVAACLHNMAVCHISMHDFREAFSLYTEARSFCEKHDLTVLIAAIDYNVAYLFFLRGEYSEAIERYEAARETCLLLGDKYRLALCSLDESEIFLELNLTLESASLARDAYSGFQDLQIPYESAKALVLLAISLSRDRRWFAAVEVLNQAREIFVSENNEAWRSQTDLYIGLVLLRAGRVYESAQHARIALEGFSELELGPKSAVCHLLIAQSLVYEQAWSRAEEQVLSAESLVKALEVPAISFLAAYFLGEIRLAQEDSQEAWGHFERAHSSLERLRSHLRSEELKVPLVEDKLLVYERLFALAAGPQENDRLAFHYLEKAKARTLSDLVATRAHSFSPRDAGRSNLATAVRQLREELNWYYRQIDLQEMRSGHPTEAGITPLREASREREEQLLRSLSDLQTSDQELSSVQQAYVADLSNIQESLSPDTALLEYYTADGVVYALTLTGQDLQITPVTVVSRVKELQRALRFQLAKFELGLEEAYNPTKQVAETIQQLLVRLGAELVQPILGQLDRPALQIVPHDFLYYVPFHALVIGDKHLGQTHRIAYTPSATVSHLLSLQPTASGRGTLILAGDNSVLSQEIVASVVRAVPEASSLACQDPRDPDFLDEISRARRVHITGEMSHRADNAMFSSLPLGGSAVSLLDLFNLRLDADLVVVAGSGPVLTSNHKGDHLLGLARGLLFAGARAVLLTLWRPPAQSLQVFLESFCSALESHSPQEALGRALEAKGLADTNPYLWAPYVLYGRP